MANQDIFELIDRFEKSSLTEMKLSTERFKLVLSRREERAKVRPAGTGADGKNGKEAGSGTVSLPEEEAAEELFITAPMVGTCYVASAPGQPPFVTPGKTVRAGETVCLMEAMKMISEIPAPCDCVIEEVLKEDGALAAFGEALFKYRPC